MKQKCYVFYCEKLKQNIGDGMQCFTCKKFEKPDSAFELKKCKHEKVIIEYSREI